MLKAEGMARAAQEKSSPERGRALKKERFESRAKDLVHKQFMFSKKAQPKKSWCYMCTTNKQMEIHV